MSKSGSVAELHDAQSWQTLVLLQRRQPRFGDQGSRSGIFSQPLTTRQTFPANSILSNLTGKPEPKESVVRSYPPKSSNMMFSRSTPKSSSIPMTAEFIMGGPHM
uniref:Uncharacterized protein n=1 Tax=Candidatus Kentrum sp. FM TaxID=2126340 RepID=A0A450SZG4_9GAMM|nr:MAG: hypothetical protein BECKFM1743A_GA0114220_102382 [Candidatus Kentron sp. FM]VFJ60154.1 MAG: hypothetical protein BECKFM1743C_GA0114222_102661 [Candidatus Kentron sp. FM]VFK13684.1 MAG: hypothetical protein BECKFM1743B_GA0114221_102912 [Candidatus Kentron sp. FM]